MKEIGEFLGWVGVVGYAIAVLNYFIKYVYKRYISKLPSDKKRYAVIYRNVMKYVVKYHKMVGIITSVAIIVHFYVMFTTKGLSVTGLIAAIIMWSIFILGIYGAYINKKVRGKWVNVHRFLAFALIVTIIVHVLFKAS